MLTIIHKDKNDKWRCKGVIIEIKVREINIVEAPIRFSFKSPKGWGKIKRIPELIVANPGILNYSNVWPCYLGELAFPVFNVRRNILMKTCWIMWLSFGRHVYKYMVRMFSHLVYVIEKSKSNVTTQIRRQKFD